MAAHPIEILHPSRTATITMPGSPLLRPSGVRPTVRPRPAGTPPEPRRRATKGRVAVDGKFFAVEGARFAFHGVSYGTFAPRSSDGAQFPDHEAMMRDIAAMASAGFTVVRTYTAPPDDLLEAARQHGMRVLAGLYYDDWRYLPAAGSRHERAMIDRAVVEIGAQAERLKGRDEVLAVVVGNEVPADAVRWFGVRRIADGLGRLVDTVHAVDPDMLVTYANYPTSEYLAVDGLDFLTYNVFLERPDELRRYLTRLHHFAGDRPLVLGEIGLHAGDTPEGERHQAEVLDWQLATALERGVGGTTLFSWTDDWWVGGSQIDDWRFGLTRADRTPRPVLDVATKWNGRTVGDLDYPWPRITVAICAYNAAATIDECLRETSKLAYPNLQILVVDDGSTDTTAEIAARHPRVEVVTIPHAGLSVARNACIAHANGDLVAYLDSDAYPSPEWLYYLALGMDGPKVGGVGGPNVPPVSDPPGAHRVAAAPGGPVHVLVADDRAEHVPGCNMAFWRFVLEEAAGFDPVYTAAGDDVDVCWKVLDRGWEIGFHPAALVWHHRRPTIRTYLRQQRGYGKAEALVAARHPDRYTSLGTARWRGRIYSSLAGPTGRQRIYRGAFGGAAYQSVYGGGGHALDLAHQLGVPAAILIAACSAVLGALVWVPLLLGVVLALAFLFGLGAYDAINTTVPRRLGDGSRRFRAVVAVLHLAQPMARWWGRARHRVAAHRDVPARDDLPAGARRAGRGVMLLPQSAPRAQMADALVSHLRRAGVVVSPVTGWEDHDGRVPGSVLVYGELLSSAHVHGAVLVRVRRRVRLRTALAAIAVVGALWLVSPAAMVVALATIAVDLAVGAVRTGPRVQRVLGALR